MSSLGTREWGALVLTENHLPTHKPGTWEIPRRTCFASLSASLTVEAALALPLFVLAVVVLSWPMKVIDGERRLRVQLEEMAENAAMAEYFTSNLSVETEDGGEIGALVARGAKLATGAGLLKAPDRDFFSGVLPEIPETDPETGIIRLGVSYEVRWPTGVFGKLVTVRHRQTAVKRAWIGRKGGAGRQYGEAPAAGTEREIVYLGRNSAESNVYHENRDCSYLTNVLRAVPAASIKDLRNTYGEKYHACPSCHPRNTGTVYVFDNGNAWHAGTDCPAIGSYVTEIFKEEAIERGMKPCHRCSR